MALNFQHSPCPNQPNSSLSGSSRAESPQPQVQSWASVLAHSLSTATAAGLWAWLVPEPSPPSSRLEFLTSAPSGLPPERRGAPSTGFSPTDRAGNPPLFYLGWLRKLSPGRGPPPARDFSPGGEQHRGVTAGSPARPAWAGSCSLCLSLLESLAA